MTHKESLFAGLHILMRAITDGPADAGRSLGRYWYRESRCKVRIGWKKTLCSLWLYSSCSSCLRGEKICEISVNPRLIKDLRLRILTYEKIKLFLQNEPNFQKSQVNVTALLTREYAQMDTWSIRKNEPKTNPNEPKTNPIYPVVASGEAGTNPIYPVVASGEAGTNPKRTQFHLLPKPRKSVPTPAICPRTSVHERSKCHCRQEIYIKQMPPLMEISDIKAFLCLPEILKLTIDKRLNMRENKSKLLSL
jgi:hypothetical protein